MIRIAQIQENQLSELMQNFIMSAQMEGLTVDKILQNMCLSVLSGTATLNHLHPFREGNGRVQRLYFRQLARQAGYHLDFAKVDSDTMMLATIRAASGIQDTLLQVFDEILSE